MKCLNDNCDVLDIEENDNFCYKCGHWTSKGYIFLNNKYNVNKLMHGTIIKKKNKLRLLTSISCIGFLIFFALILLRGDDLLRPYYYFKRKIDYNKYGYNTAIIETNNIYNKKKINDIEAAEDIIYKDLSSQNFKCSYSLESFEFERDLQIDHNIINVSLCDIPYKEAEKIKDVIDKVYSKFTDIDGALTNISITNALTKDEYVARFQPMFQFVNPNEDINEYNKVNKTQILLNSYYFLNPNILNNPIEKVVGNNWYVNDATWESTIAHELGHYIVFKSYLKQNNLDNIILITKDNEKTINELLSNYDNGIYSMNILNEALDNYNNKYNEYLDINAFALTISNYAGIKNDKGILIADETIAEAVHDYYLHDNLCKNSSKEIINILKSRL